MASLQPLITICGTTGVGKSKLAVELALALAHTSRAAKNGYRGARVINADAMQAYAGMDIITNKIPTEEMQGVEHLLMSFKRPGQQYVIGEWVKDAMRAIDETHRMGQVPIVVGGTSYWIQHLLFPNRLVSIESNHWSSKGATPTSKSLAEAICSLPCELLDLFHALPAEAPSAVDQPELASAMHQLLSALDPPVAQRLHWRDTRKNLRQLTIIKESGRLSSEILTEQSQIAPRPRYRTLLFWLYTKPDTLKPLLDLRVDRMVEQGLLDEIRGLRAQLSSGTATAHSANDSTNDGNGSEKESVDVDYTLGIYQSIGYKEFHDYLGAPAHSDDAFQQAIQNMKTATRRYAKRQIMWIRNQLLPAVRAANTISQIEKGCEVVSTYVLDSSELGTCWEMNVRDTAQNITDAFLKAEELPDPLSLFDTARNLLVEKPTDTTPRRKLICEVCTYDKERPVMIQEGAQWKVHIRTRHHRKRAVKLQLYKLKHNQSADSPADEEGSGVSQDPLYETSTLYL